MGPGGRRPSHPWDRSQITPNPGSHVRPGHLPPNLVSLPQSCEGLPECNGAAGLGSSEGACPLSAMEACLPEVYRVPEIPEVGRQLACHPFGVRFRSGGDHL